MKPVETCKYDFMERIADNVMWRTLNFYLRIMRKKHHDDYISMLVRLNGDAYDIIIKRQK